MMAADAGEAGVPFRLLETAGTDWSPDGLQPTVNARVDARLVPSPTSPDGECKSFPQSKSCPVLLPHECTLAYHR